MLPWRPDRPLDLRRVPPATRGARPTNPKARAMNLFTVEIRFRESPESRIDVIDMLIASSLDKALAYIRNHPDDCRAPIWWWTVIETELDVGGRPRAVCHFRPDGTPLATPKELILEFAEAPPPEPAAPISSIEIPALAAQARHPEHLARAAALKLLKLRGLEPAVPGCPCRWCAERAQNFTAALVDVHRNPHMIADPAHG
jgi:hypothetical protein